MSIKKTLDNQLSIIKLSEHEKSSLNKLTNLVIATLEHKIKKKKIDASVFLGGSLAKDTIMKKPSYDIDIFIRFNKKYSEEQIKKYMKSVFRFFRIPKIRTKTSKIHGSRDYYKLILRPFKRITFEIIPTIKIQKPEQARNITDLSYFHVQYFNKKKTKKVLDEILLAKAFCYAQKCYGAESYVKGFSGYALELLILHYKTFRKFLTQLSKVKDKEIIDIAKHYKPKTKITQELSPAKLHSPIILIDPTYKERNAASALSPQTFHHFQKSAKEFLKKPSCEFFEYKKVNTSYLKQIAREYQGIFAVFEIKTNKQPGDIAGTKLLKFSKLLSNEIEKVYEIIKHEFEYDNHKRAKIYYILKRKKERIRVGPSIHMPKAVHNFKQKHPIWYIEDGKIKSAKPTDIKIKDFLKNFKKTNRKTIKEMDIAKIKII